MKLLPACIILLAAASLAVAQSPEDGWMLQDLSTLEDFTQSDQNWQLAGLVSADRNTRYHLATEEGAGILVNVPGQAPAANLFFGWEHGDIHLDLEFMMPKGSNSGIYLQGRYEIQLLDSWGAERPTFGDVGGIYQRWNESMPQGERGFQGHAPLHNAARAPGLWQRLKLEFQAPLFDESGRKTANARLLSATLNGQVIHRNVELTGPTRGAALPGEAPFGPIMIQGDHGPVAFRNIRYRLELEPEDPEATPPRAGSIHVQPTHEPALIRGFVNHGGQKKTHTIAVGYPGGVHFTMDLRQGGLLHVWKGAFIETTDMWHSRGQAQLAVPRGAVVTLSGQPAVAGLETDNAAWPDSMSADFAFDGYQLDAEGRPTFVYTLGDLQIQDSVTPTPGGLSRQVTAQGNTEGYWVRAAVGSDIRPLGDGNYSVADGSYYLEIPEESRPMIRSTGTGSELLLPMADGTPVTYTLIW